MASWGGLVPAISIKMTQRSMIGMAGTSPAMTKWEMPRVYPCYAFATHGFFNIAKIQVIAEGPRIRCLPRNRAAFTPSG